ncbi:MAG: Mrp/NBP35 family ATP-binding protein [Calditrichia bacterium]
MKDKIKAILDTVSYPGFKRSIVSFGVVKEIEHQDDTITVHLHYTTSNNEVKKQIKQAVAEKLGSELSEYKIYIKETSAEITAKPQAKSAPQDPWADRAPIPGIKNIIAVASGKGGVGKSTVSTNLALALQKKGLQVGLMDADIYGPSVHIMMGARSKPYVNDQERIIPLVKHGIKLITMGTLLEESTPVIWRGPMVMKAIEQFLNDVEWGELDVLVIDLPPGTGDAQLTLVQKVPVNGAIIVTTPQEVSLVDARRGLKMFERVDTPVWGIIENMSYFICNHCNEKTFIFGEDGGKKAAEEMGTGLLGQIPIETSVREAGDKGVPVVEFAADSVSAKTFLAIAEKIKDNLVR